MVTSKLYFHVHSSMIFPLYVYIVIYIFYIFSQSFSTDKILKKLVDMKVRMSKIKC